MLKTLSFLLIDPTIFPQRCVLCNTPAAGHRLVSHGLFSRVHEYHVFYTMFQLILVSSLWKLLQHDTEGVYNTSNCHVCAYVYPWRCLCIGMSGYVSMTANALKVPFTNICLSSVGWRGYTLTWMGVNAFVWNYRLHIIRRETGMEQMLFVLENLFACWLTKWSVVMVFLGFVVIDS